MILCVLRGVLFKMILSLMKAAMVASRIEVDLLLFDDLYWLGEDPRARLVH